MTNILNIAAKTRRVEVDNRFSLRFYNRTAAHLLKQASIYREERNVIDLYILLLRYSSLVSETIPEHRDYRLTSQRERAENKKRLVEVLSELEYLKPEVQRQVERLNRTHRLPPGSGSEADWAALTQWPTALTTVNTIGQELNKEYRRSEPAHYGPSHHGSPYYQDNHDPGRAGVHRSYQSVSNSIEDQLGNLSLSIPRARDETLSRHSFLASNAPRRPPPPVPFKARYPHSYIDASPIEMPSLSPDWRVPLQRNEASNTVDNFGEPVLWPEADRRHFPDGGYSPVIGPDLAPIPAFIRQPDPPPVLAPVHSADYLDQTLTQLPPERVADPHPGTPRNSEDLGGQENGTKHLHISTRVMEEFLALSKVNTQMNLETCGVLAGSLKKGVFYVSALIIPKQEATSDSCQTINEEEIFDVQDKRGLFQLGWIHTHPTQTCFMSAIDLHTHYSYQIMLQEAIAIVMAPTDTQRKYGIFRLSDPGGIRSIQQCDKRGFHPHEELPDGSPIYEHCGHVFMSPKLKFDVIDLRQS